MFAVEFGHLNQGLCGEGESEFDECERVLAGLIRSLERHSDT